VTHQRVGIASVFGIEGDAGRDTDGQLSPADLEGPVSSPAGPSEIASMHDEG